MVKRQNENGSEAFLYPFVPKSRLNEIEVKSIPMAESLDARRMAAKAKLKDEARKKKRKIGFNKDKSVFKPWKVDNSKILNECAQLDLEYWKLPRICKDQDDQMKCE